MSSTPPRPSVAEAAGCLREALDSVRRSLDEVRGVAGSGNAASASEWVELAALSRELEGAAAATGMVAAVAVAATDEVLTEHGELVEVDRGPGHRRLDAPDLLAPACACTPGFAAARVERAVRLATHLPGVLDLLAGGTLTEYGVRVVADATRDLDPDQCRRVLDVLLPWVDRSSPATAGRLRSRVREVIARVAPESLEDASTTARRDRCLSRTRDRVGAQTWEAVLVDGPGDLAWAAVDRLAGVLRRDGQADTLEQARADALVALVLASTTLDLRVDVAVTSETATVEEALPRTALVAVRGLGPDPVEVPDAWLRALVRSSATTSSAHSSARSSARSSKTAGGPGSRVMARTVLVDAGTGSRLDGGPAASTSYSPPTAMARWVRARDGRCRFPGCDVIAHRCDLDHVLPWPAGPTSPENLLTLCRHHHRVKQRPGWSVVLDPDGRARWRDPLGRVSSTTPVGPTGVPFSKPSAGSAPDRPPDPPPPTSVLELAHATTRLRLCHRTGPAPDLHHLPCAAADLRRAVPTGPPPF